MVLVDDIFCGVSTVTGLSLLFLFASVFVSFVFLSVSAVPMLYPVMLILLAMV
jgi:hypothetical protein